MFLASIITWCLYVESSNKSAFETRICYIVQLWLSNEQTFTYAVLGFCIKLN